MYTRKLVMLVRNVCGEGRGGDIEAKSIVLGLFDFLKGTELGLV